MMASCRTILGLPFSCHFSSAKVKLQTSISSVVEQ